jgi:hypothetical protein
MTKPEEIEVVFEDYDPEDDAPPGNLTGDHEEGDCAGEDGD